MARRLRLLRSEEPRDPEAGFALVEVIVSAVVLATVALAILAGIDASARSTGREKAKAVAVSLAEQDQERMRGIAAKQVTDVTNLGPYTINGATYTVKSEAVWVDDSTGGTDSCANTGSKASYIRMTSTVTAGNLVAPVVISSLVEPPISSADAGEGYLAVQVNDKDGTGVKGVAVHAAGPTVDDATTNDAGCAVFGRVGVGDYDFTLTKTGYVDEFGRSPGLKQKVSVAQDAKTVAAVKFDQAAPLTVKFETSIPGSSTIVNTGARVSAFDSEAPAVLSWGDGVTASSTMLLNLFPYNTPYASIYTGSCDDADPLAVYGNNYYTATPFQGTFAAKPGIPGTVTLHEPPVAVQVKRSGSDWQYAKVRLTGTCDNGSGSLETFDLLVTKTTTTSAPSGKAGYVSWSTTSYDPGMPYGTYNMCVKTTTNTGTTPQWKQQSITLNDPVKGRSAGTLSFDTNSGGTTTYPGSACPA